MSGKQPMQAPGRDKPQTNKDDTGSAGKGSSESSGGPYPNPHTDGDGDDDSFGSHGGQTRIEYEGPENPNATTKGG